MKTETKQLVLLVEKERDITWYNSTFLHHLMKSNHFFENESDKAQFKELSKKLYELLYKRQWQLTREISAILEADEVKREKEEDKLVKE